MITKQVRVKADKHILCRKLSIHANLRHKNKFTVLGIALLLSQSIDVFAEVHSDLSYFNNYSTSNFNLQQTIRGNIVDTNGSPLVGVSIREAGSNNVVLSDSKGQFVLDVKNSNAVVEMSFVGYTTLKKKSNENFTNVVLESLDMALDEVVVVGYGTQKKQHLTGAVSTISGDDLQARPVQNVAQSLQGLMPGLNVQTDGLGGELNQSMSINIRGAGTIGTGSSSSPLILIDGMEGDLNSINPQDIENISVLKDVAASSIYGSRAPFGVILITTKSGKEGRTSVGYNNNVRLSSPRGLPTMLDSKTFAHYYNEVAGNSNQGVVFNQEVLDLIDAYQRGEISTTTTANSSNRFNYYGGSNGNTNWFEEFYRDFTTSHEHTINVNGGNEKVNFYTSGGFMDQNGLNRYANDNFQRYTFNNKVNVKINEKLDFMSNTRFSREDYDRPTHMNALFYHNIARRWPTVPVYDNNGNYAEPNEITQLLNGGRSNNQKDDLSQQFQLTYRPIKNWNIVGNVNYKIQNRNNHTEVLKAYAYDVENNAYPMAVSDFAAGYTGVTAYNLKSDYLSANFFTDYTFKINDLHDFKILAGFNSELFKNRDLSGSRSDLITDNVPTLNTATNNPNTSGGFQHWATSGFFGRFNYNYADRYLLELNGRYDGSSRFPRHLRWNFFPSVSAGWNIANEEFFPLKESISMLKLRGSYGELGNQGTNNWYPFYSVMPVTAGNGTWLLGNTKPNVANAPGLISENLTWERVASWNIGADIQTLQNRLNISLEVYKRNTFDMIGPAPLLPAILGTGVPEMNNADMYSKGFEIDIAWKDKVGQVGYSIRGVLSDDRQTVTKFNNPSGNLNTWYSGRRNGEIWGYTTVGMAKSQAEMDAHLQHTQQTFSTQWFAGDIMYKDLNGDGVINNGANTLSNPGDYSIIGNAQPRYRYSFDVAANYKGFDIRAFFQGVGKRDHFPNGPYFWGASGGMWQSAGFAENMDYFRDETSLTVQNGVLDVNTDAYLPRPYFNSNKNTQVQTRYLLNAAYLRLKNAQIGYTLSQETLKKVRLSRMRVYLSGENLLTFTKMSKVFDPETVGLGGWNDGKTYPFSTVYSFGISANF